MTEMLPMSSPLPSAPWAAPNNQTITILSSKLEEALFTVRHQSYNDGYNTGKDHGYRQGFEDGVRTTQNPPLPPAIVLRSEPEDELLPLAEETLDAPLQVKDMDVHHGKTASHHAAELSAQARISRGHGSYKAHKHAYMAHKMAASHHRDLQHFSHSLGDKKSALDHGEKAHVHDAHAKFHKSERRRLAKDRHTESQAKKGLVHFLFKKGYLEERDGTIVVKAKDALGHGSEKRGIHGKAWDEGISKSFPGVKVPVFHATTGPRAIQIIEQGFKAGSHSDFGKGNVGSTSMTKNLDWATEGHRGNYIFVMDEKSLEKHGEIIDHKDPSVEEEYERRFVGDKIPTQEIKGLVINKTLGSMERKEAAEWGFPVVYKTTEGWATIQPKIDTKALSQEAHALVVKAMLCRKKKQWVSAKIAIIMKDGIRGHAVSQAQAVAVANKLWKKKSNRRKAPIEAKAFDESKHPRGAKGTSTGGQFTKGSAGSYSHKEKIKEVREQHAEQLASASHATGSEKGKSRPKASTKGAYVNRNAYLTLKQKVMSKIEHIAQSKELRPTKEEIKENKANIAKKGANQARKDLNGNNIQRRERKVALAKEFGDGKTCGCGYCGLVISYSPEYSQYSMEEDKIIETAAGGRYRMSNLIPACVSCNRSRGDRSATDFLTKSTYAQEKE